MFIETLDTQTRSKVFESFFGTTAEALVEVFGKSEREARELIETLSRKFAEAPTREQNLLLHNDPVALASDLAEVPWANVDAQRLQAFVSRRRPSRPAT